MFHTHTHKHHTQTHSLTLDTALWLLRLTPITGLISIAFFYIYIFIYITYTACAVAAPPSCCFCSFCFVPLSPTLPSPVCWFFLPLLTADLTVPVSLACLLRCHCNMATAAVAAAAPLQRGIGAGSGDRVAPESSGLADNTDHPIVLNRLGSISWHLRKLGSDLKHVHRLEN